MLDRVSRGKIAVVHEQRFIFDSSSLRDDSSPPPGRKTHVVTKAVVEKQSREDHPLVFCGVMVCRLGICSTLGLWFGLYFGEYILVLQRPSY